MNDCGHCGCARVVPVLHARMIGQPYGGNPYRSYCLECDRFGPAVAKSDWKEPRNDPHVLPKDAPKDDPDSVIPLEQWDEAERYQQVLERIQNYRDRPTPTAATDGGETTDVVEEEVEEETVPESESDVDDDEPAENRFMCPQCGVEQTGYPEACADCGAAYNWT